MMATLLLSQGTPMILAGDELGHSQGGNNNAYNQDNETTWIDWDAVDHDFLAFTKQMIAFRKAHPMLRQSLFLHARERLSDGLEDVFWRRADGDLMQDADWMNAKSRLLIAELRMASGSPAYAEREDAICLVFNAGRAADITLPTPPEGKCWTLCINTNDAQTTTAQTDISQMRCPAMCVLAFTLGPVA